MSLKDRLQAGLNKIIRDAGTPISVKYFGTTIGSVWDDDVSLTQTGATIWTSGVIFPLDNTQGSFDSVLVEQGKLTNQDSKLFVVGSLSLTGSESIVKIGIGSPAAEEYTTIPEGAIAPQVEATLIYRKAFISRVPLGSLLGE